jgi:hypothetical protein
MNSWYPRTTVALATLWLGACTVDTQDVNSTFGGGAPSTSSDTAAGSSGAASASVSVSSTTSQTTTSDATGGGSTSGAGTSSDGSSSAGSTSSTTTAASSSSSSTTTGGLCGNGTIDAGEQCDGADLNSFDCTSLGYSGGTLACGAATCTFDTTLCNNDTTTTGGVCVEVFDPCTVDADCCPGLLCDAFFGNECWP